MLIRFWCVKISPLKGNRRRSVFCESCCRYRLSVSLFISYFRGGMSTQRESVCCSMKKKQAKHCRSPAMMTTITVRAFFSHLSCLDRIRTIFSHCGRQVPVLLAPNERTDSTGFKRKKRPRTSVA